MVYIVAEIGCNHNGDMELARKLVDAAIESGVDAVKFQTFKADKLISKHAPKADYQIETTGNSESQLEMTKKLEMSFDEYLEIKKYTESKGVDVFSTAFDDESLNFLISTGMDIFKIPSGELTNLTYLEKIGKQKKKVILSTGMAVMSEIHDAVDILEKNGTTDITILHCTTQYPTLSEDLNLHVITTLQKEFPNNKIGYSDHSVGHFAATVAAGMGSSFIEKHFTLDTNLPGPDHHASATPEVMTEVVKGVRFVEKAMGSYEKEPVAVEIKNKIVARKSIIAATNITKGEVFTEKNITTKRPGNGISPMKWYEVLGTVAERDFEEDEVIESSKFKGQEL
ncbi:N-acetylneuraminate synthase [Lactococcus formosensis]|uniref:N-acetylneuraminate synthase n=1 Tax=Lactococcus formosensis TaxID=1281486 RepID=UPI002434CE5B|nr:N-acetylneuraminate synthase [Lactococcus formosensis]MDG6126099.1 N-acetylneuraminate synthase [Lactococcus formosensis]MDG6187902.1 N-acetylneuraminate synthase [Lactococcus formosensis]